MEGGQIVDDPGVSVAPAHSQAAGRRADLIGQPYRFARRRIQAHATFVKFTLSGVLGYAFYQGALVAAHDLAGVQFFIATLIAAEVSIIGGFFVRDLWVFTDGPIVQRSLTVRFWQYQAKSIVSTLAIVTATVNILTGGFDVPHFISTPIGVVMGFAWNWGWERSFIWRPQTTDDTVDKTILP